MRIVGIIVMTCLGAVAFGQRSADCSPDDSAHILSIQNLASRSTTLAPGTIAKVLWCDLEFPAATTPISSVSLDGIPIPYSISPQSVFQTTSLSSVLSYGYPGFTPRELRITIPPIAGTFAHNPTVQLMQNGGLLASLEAELEDFSPGLFTMDQKLNGPVVARNPAQASLNADYIGGNSLVYVGDTITVYATGLGAADQFAGTLPVIPDVYVGDQPAVVIDARPITGITAFFAPPGLYQVTFVVPPVGPSDNPQPIYIQIGGVKSNVAKLAVRP